MAGPFPNEQALSTHDAIDLTEQGYFESFENDLQNTNVGANQTKRDYEFRAAGANGRILLAKPTKTGNLWATELTPGSPNHGQWVEGAQYDPVTGGIDSSNSPQATAPTGAPGSCPSCGTTGVSGKFCFNCAAPLPAAPAPGACHLCNAPNVAANQHSGPMGPMCNSCGGLLSPPSVALPPGILGVPLPGPAQVPTAGQLAPGQSPVAGAGAQMTPIHINPNRMEGKPKKEVVIPKGMSVTESTGFADDLDKLLAEAEANQAAEQ